MYGCEYNRPINRKEVMDSSLELHTQVNTLPIYRRGCPTTDRPPSSTICAPVTCADPGLARKSTA